MDDVFHTANRTCHLWRCVFPLGIRGRLVTSNDPSINLSINEFELLVHLAQLTLVGPTMRPSTMSTNDIDNFVSFSWGRRGSISCKTMAGVIFCAYTLLLHHYGVHNTLRFLTGI